MYVGMGGWFEERSLPSNFMVGKHVNNNPTNNAEASMGWHTGVFLPRPLPPSIVR